MPGKSNHELHEFHQLKLKISVIREIRGFNFNRVTHTEKHPISRGAKK
jgi:hypothetical protein